MREVGDECAVLVGDREPLERRVAAPQRVAGERPSVTAQSASLSAETVSAQLLTGDQAFTTLYSPVTARLITTVMAAWLSFGRSPSRPCGVLSSTSLTIGVVVTEAVVASA